MDDRQPRRTGRPGTEPTVPTTVLRALSRYPDRVAFEWDGGSLTYRDTLALIGRMQTVLSGRGLGRGNCLALLSGNRADGWCALMAAQGLGITTTALHPLGSADDQRYQLADAGAEAIVVDVASFGERGGEIHDSVDLALTLGPADYGVDLIAAAERSGASTAVSVAVPDDIAVINYTGGTTGRSKGAMRRHRSYGGMTGAVLASFEIPSSPRFLAVAPISHVAGTKVIPTLIRGGTVYLVQGFDPEQVIEIITDHNINMTLLVPTMIYSILDCPALDLSAGPDGRTLPSLELLMYGASPMAPTRLAEGLPSRSDGSTRATSRSKTKRAICSSSTGPRT